MSQVAAPTSAENETAAITAGKAPLSASKGVYSSHGVRNPQNPSNQSAADDTSSAKSRTTALKRASPKTGLQTINVTKIKGQFISKKKEFVALREELSEKEKHARTLFTDIAELREKIIVSGSKDPGQIEGFKFEVGAQAIVAPSEPTPKITAERVIEFLKHQLQETQKKSLEYCQDSLEKHSLLLTLLARFSSQNEVDEVDSNTDVVELSQQLRVHQKSNELLKSRLDEMRSAQVELEVQLSKDIVELYEDCQSFQSRFKECETSTIDEDKVDKVKPSQGDEVSLPKERMRQLDLLLERTRSKNRELEAHIASDQAKIQQLQEKMKNMEQQIKQKNQLMDQRMKAMTKTAKNNESLMTKVEKQRDSFESRLLELKQEMSTKERDAQEQIKEMRNDLEQATTTADSEREKRELAEAELAEFKERYQNLEEKSQQLCELAEKNKPPPLSDGNHTESEVRLFNELQATRAELDRQRAQMSQLQREKEEIVAVMHQAANRDDGGDSNSKLAAELVFQTGELKNLAAQYHELEKVAKSTKERNGILENQLRDLQLGLHAQMVESGKSTINAHTIELQQQVSDLRNSLMETLKQKEELEGVLTQKQLELEQRDQVLRDQTKFLKIRDEMLGLLRAKDQQGSGETSSDDNTEEIDQQIAVRREAIQELYKTITNKQLQVMRLEKMVKLMEDQQDRAQAQRTRLENRIAQLELALQKNKEQRNKGFGIL